MYELYDVVKAERKISEEIPKGTLGTILIIHNQFIPLAYEVEFVNSDMENIGVVTVKEEDLKIYSETSSDV